MSIWNRLFARETRAETVTASDPYLAEFFGQRAGLGGLVSSERASGLATAQACISTVAQSLAAVPLNLYRRSDNGGRGKAVEHPLHAVLHDMANPAQTAFEAREALIASLLIAGNAFSRLEWNGRGQVVALHPLDPGVVAVERLANGRLRYRISGTGGGVTVHTQEEVLHLRHRLARDGIMGLSPIQIARETFALALTQQDQAGAQAGKAFRPEGALVFPRLSRRARRRVRWRSCGRRSRRTFPPPAFWCSTAASTGSLSLFHRRTRSSWKAASPRTCKFAASSAFHLPASAFSTTAPIRTSSRKAGHW